MKRADLRNLVLVILGSAVVYLIGNESIGLWDRDEPRYAQTSRQMLQSGDWVVPMLLDQPREKKPVFIYWCQAAAMSVLGGNAFAARLPSAICVTLTLIVLAGVLWKTIGPRRAVWTTFIFATSGLTIAAAKMSITDGVLVLFITSAQLCLYAILRGRGSWPVVIACGISVGLGLLTKGPVVLGVMGMTIIALLALQFFDHHKFIVWRCSIPKWIVGVLLALAVYASWGVAIERRSPNYHFRTIKSEIIDRATTPQEGHSGPPGFYLIAVWGTLFPWSLLLPLAIVYGWRNRRIAPIRFALAATVGPWVMFEVVKTKLPHYILPTYPAIAFLIADALIRVGREVAQWRRAPGRAGPIADRFSLGAILFWGSAIFIVCLGPILAMIMFGPQPPSALVAMILLPVFAFEYARSVYLHFRAVRPLEAAAFMGVGMMLLVSVICGLYLPNAEYLQISKRVAEVLRADGATHRGDAVMIDYDELSLPFYQGGTIRPQPDHFLEKTPAIEWPKWVVTTRDIWDQTPDAIHAQFDILTTVHGLNQADRMRILDVLVLRKR